MNLGRNSTHSDFTGIAHFSFFLCHFKRLEKFVVLCAVISAPTVIIFCCSTQSAPQALVSTPQENGSEEKAIDDARVCQICFMEERGVVFLPCGHLVACVKCAPSLSTCAVCRQPFTGTVRVFLS